jgi:glucose-1-phosphatase
VDLYLFDLDKTLYAYNFRKRLPALARITGVSQYRLASTWWAAGFEARAERGEWTTPEEYLQQFARVTGAELTLEQWTDARKQAMTPIRGAIEALERCASLGTISLFSNNPAPLGAALEVLAPDVAAILDGNEVYSYQLGVRKPAPEAFELALARYGVSAENAFLADDTKANIVAARSIGIHAHRFTTVGLLDAAVNRFAERAR